MLKGIASPGVHPPLLSALRVAQCTLDVLPDEARVVAFVARMVDDAPGADVTAA